MYGIGGERDLTEHTLDHLSGWGNSRPVRVRRRCVRISAKNDSWGMISQAVDTHIRWGTSQILHPVWQGLASLVEQAIQHADDPDQGIWEIRGDPEHFTASKVLCWVAAERATWPACVTTTSVRTGGSRRPTP